MQSVWRPLEVINSTFSVNNVKNPTVKTAAWAAMTAPAGTQKTARQNSSLGDRNGQVEGALSHFPILTVVKWGK